ncbi:DNA alkylation repair protein [Arthrobacter sp. M4]|uniref:DNA alkylation repair protein n=1 Tax=Arthrobacter sp. M4 TaxID=218160 RepID=UPI001CDCED1F|nr:DNA alkylation repair protein [Arthrobacter sp. M4]MCA4131308.1 DNA alkylation repair protein [Arthrobacter sp. M4]
MSDAAEFVDSTIQREANWIRAEDYERTIGTGLRFYGASVGAVRGTVRDALRRYRGLTHDQITALSSELWDVPIFERRLAAVVLLQSNVELLTGSDLTRLEGFLRQAPLPELADPLAVDVVGPLLAGLEGAERYRADRVTERWAGDEDPWLRRAALLSHAASLKVKGAVAGAPDLRGRNLATWAAQADDGGTKVPEIVQEAIRQLTGEDSG